MMIVLTSLLALCALGGAAEAYTLHAYWGQNKASSFTQDPALYEPTLTWYCSNRARAPYNTITIGFMTRHYMSSSDKVPGLQLTNHCSMVFSGHAQPASPGSAAFLNCPALTSQIQYCQSQGVKVLLGVSPTDSLADDTDGANSAQNVWNYFLGGSASQRPFGAAVLDGVDMYVRSGGVNGYVGFVTRLNALFRGQSSRPYSLVASPLAATGNAYYGPQGATNTMLYSSTTACMFTSFNLFMMTIPQHYFNTDLFYGQLQYWYTWLNSLGCSSGVTPPYLVGLPSHDGWADDSPGDYIAPWTWQNATVLAKLRAQSPLFSGIAIYDASLDVVDAPCANSASTYSKWITQDFTLDRSSSAYVRCTGPPASTAAGGGGTKTSTKTGACANGACTVDGGVSGSGLRGLAVAALALTGVANAVCAIPL